MVINNAYIPESLLKKQYVAICCHRIREACTAGVIRITKESTDTNLADLLTKKLDRERHKLLMRIILRYSQFQLSGTAFGWNDWTSCKHGTLYTLEVVAYKQVS